MRVRPPAVAGTFYPADAEELAGAVDGYLSDGRAALAAVESLPTPKALIVPHAGYIYSGPVAGAAYALAQSRCAGIERVVLLGPAHRVALGGMAISSADAFATPLGMVRIDRATCDVALTCAGVEISDRAHEAEHSLEVQLPFLQRILPRFHLVPLVVGSAREADVAVLLDHLWKGAETLFVISSDLSHYYDYATANRLDRATCETIEALDADSIDEESACGRIPIRGLLRVARRRGLHARLLDRRNSGDTAGERDQVVGYAAFAVA